MHPDHPNHPGHPDHGDPLAHQPKPKTSWKDKIRNIFKSKKNQEKAKEAWNDPKNAEKKSKVLGFLKKKFGGHKKEHHDEHHEEDHSEHHEGHHGY